MSRKTFLKVAGFGSALAALPLSALVGGLPKTAHKTFEESASLFPNPERGWHASIDPAFWNDTTMPHRPEQAWLKDEALTPEKLRERRAVGVSLVRKYYHLYPYRDRPIPEQYLKEHPIHDLRLVRENGFKLIPRFIYTWTFEIDGGVEATFERMMGHLDQLAPILRENADVLSHLEVGLVGTGGEWHDSGGGYLSGSWTSPTTHNTYASGLNAKSKAVIEKVLEVLPENRMALLRGIPYLQQYVYETTGGDVTPISEGEAYGGTDKARLGLHDDSFLYDATDRGTYWPPTTPEGARIRASQRAYQAQTTRFAPMSGEPSAVDSKGYAFKSDPFVELAKMHWCSMNDASYEAVRDGLYDFWRDRGAYDEIGRRLGYRFSLASANVQSEAAPGGAFGVSFEVNNTGFAAPHNRRLLEVVLRAEKTGEEFFLPLNDDPRRWEPGRPAVIGAVGLLPSDASAGVYEVLLNLPDPNLPNRPEYSVRFANDGVFWEAYSGYNALGMKTRLAGPALDASISGLPAFARRENPPVDRGETAVTIPASGRPEARPAPTPELTPEENDVLVGFDDRPDAKGVPLTGSYGGIEWGTSGAWRTASDGYGKYLYLSGEKTRAQATFRLPPGKVLKSFMLLKRDRRAAVNRILARSAGREYVWDNPAPWWAQHVLLEDWTDASSEVTFVVESDGERLAANLLLDNVVYGEPSRPTLVTFEDLPAGSVLTGLYAGIDWGSEKVWRVGESSASGKFIYLDANLLPKSERLDKKTYFALPDGMVLKSVEVGLRSAGANDKILFSAIPPRRDNPKGSEYDFEGAGRMPVGGWQNLSFAYAKPWGKVGVEVRSRKDNGRGVANVLLKSLTYRREIRLAT